MDQQAQQAMDGSPALVTRTLSELQVFGKFARGLVEEGHLHDAVISIRFQCGPLQEIGGVNGCSIEDVIDVLVARLEGFQRGRFHCRENALAITNLWDAKHWLLKRTGTRQVQGVEGRNEAHRS